MNANTRILDTLPDSHKVYDVAAVLHVHPARALGIMVRWLTWVDAHCTTAETRLMAKDMDTVCFGQRGVFAAFKLIGWVRADEFGRVHVVDYDKYLSPTSKVRAATAERKARFRNKKKAAAAESESATAKGVTKQKGGKA